MGVLYGLEGIFDTAPNAAVRADLLSASLPASGSTVALDIFALRQLRKLKKNRAIDGCVSGKAEHSRGWALISIRASDSDPRSAKQKNLAVL